MPRYYFSQGKFMFSLYCVMRLILAPVKYFKQFIKKCIMGETWWLTKSYQEKFRKFDYNIYSKGKTIYIEGNGLKLQQGGGQTL